MNKDLNIIKKRRFIETVKLNVAKGKRAMFSIISISCQIHLFKITVIPIFLYGCEAWGYENVDKLKKHDHCFAE